MQVCGWAAWKDTLGITAFGQPSEEIKQRELERN